MKFHAVVTTVMKYLEGQMVPGMNELQEFAFYALWESVNDEATSWAELLSSNPALRAITAIDKDGNVDVDKLIARVRKALERKGKLTVDVPCYGAVCFTPADIDEIGVMLKGVANETGA